MVVTISSLTDETESQSSASDNSLGKPLDTFPYNKDKQKILK